jgi:hypothetical protein
MTVELCACARAMEIEQRHGFPGEATNEAPALGETK